MSFKHNIVHLGGIDVYADVVDDKIEYLSMRFKGVELHFYGEEVEDLVLAVRAVHRFSNSLENKKEDNVRPIIKMQEVTQ